MNKCASILNVSKDSFISFNIFKKSIDARKKPNIYYSFIVDIYLKNEDIIFKNNKNKDVVFVNEEDLIYKFIPSGDIKLKNRPIIVGCGPCGLIAGYMLASYGYRPIIIEQGMDVDTRDKDIIDQMYNLVKVELGRFLMVS